MESWMGQDNSSSSNVVLPRHLDLMLLNIFLDFHDFHVTVRIFLVVVSPFVLLYPHYLPAVSSRPETRPAEPLSSSTDSLSHDCSYFCFCM
jgi:hypothetical protein